MTEDPRKRRFDYFWLVLPWLTVGALILAEATGFRRWIFTKLPNELGAVAQRNVGWGVLLLTFVSSVRWMFLRWKNRPRDPFVSWAVVVFWSFLITLSHISVAAGILFAGCMFVLWNR